MGRAVAGPEFLEGRMTEYLVSFFADLQVPYQRIEVVPGRCNVIARLDRPGSKTTLLFDAHQDTVPVDGMTIPPFEPTERDGRIFGRGACDVKGGMAAMLAAFARLVHERPASAANVVVSCTCDEEFTVLGISDLAKLWSDPGRRGSLLGQRPDAAVVVEPTELDVVVAHKGATRWKVRTRGPGLSQFESRRRGSTRFIAWPACSNAWKSSQTSCLGACRRTRYADRRR